MRCFPHPLSHSFRTTALGGDWAAPCPGWGRRLVQGRRSLDSCRRLGATGGGASLPPRGRGPQCLRPNTATPPPAPLPRTLQGPAALAALPVPTSPPAGVRGVAHLLLPPWGRGAAGQVREPLGACLRGRGGSAPSAPLPHASRAFPVFDSFRSVYTLSPSGAVRPPGKAGLTHLRASAAPGTEKALDKYLLGCPVPLPASPCPAAPSPWAHTHSGPPASHSHADTHTHTHSLSAPPAVDETPSP